MINNYKMTNNINDKLVSSFLDSKGNIVDFRDKDGELQKGTLAVTFFGKFNNYMIHTGLHSLSKEPFLKLQKELFEEYAGSIHLTPTETRDCLHYYLDI